MKQLRAIIITSFALATSACSDSSTSANSSETSSLQASVKPKSFLCESADDNAPYGIEKFKVSIVNDYTARVNFSDLRSPNTGEYLVDLDYKPRTEETKKYERAHLEADSPLLDNSKSIETLFVEKSLFDGGRHRGNGVYGGKVRMQGQGYSWASFDCKGEAEQADASIVCEVNRELYRYNHLDDFEDLVFLDSCYAAIDSGEICYEGDKNAAADLLEDIAEEDGWDEEYLDGIDVKRSNIYYNIVDSHNDRILATNKMSPCKS